jgi:hypothetical protein
MQRAEEVLGELVLRSRVVIGTKADCVSVSYLSRRLAAMSEVCSRRNIPCVVWRNSVGTGKPHVRKWTPKSGLSGKLLDAERLSKCRYGEVRMDIGSIVLQTDNKAFPPIRSYIHKRPTKAHTDFPKHSIIR